MHSEQNRRHPMPDTPNPPLSIATFNVNGIRAARRRGFENWLAERRPDVVALQELRCPPEEVGAFDGYRAAIDCGSIPG
ncbi:endonuclease/exonuclease/phosphatase family protein, partial [Mycolicibacterium porcinum]